MRPSPLKHPFANQEAPPNMPVNKWLADNAYQAGYLLQHMREYANRLERGVSPDVIVESMRETIDNCELAMGREP